MWTALIILASFGAGSGEIYTYPDAYERGDGLGAAVNEEALAALWKARSPARHLSPVSLLWIYM